MSPRARSTRPAREALARPPHGRLRRRGPAALVLAGLAPTLLVLGPATTEAAAADGTCVTSGLSTTCTFGFTGAPQQWVVPAGVRSATFRVVGAAGGLTDVPPLPVEASQGGGVEATVKVVPGSTMQIYVGGRGSDSGAGGWNGGGNGGGTAPHGAGGGGASDVRVAPYGLAMRILVGGGGGGQGARAFYWASGRSPGFGGDGGGSTGGGAGPGSVATTAGARGTSPVAGAARPTIPAPAVWRRRARKTPGASARSPSLVLAAAAASVSAVTGATCTPSAAPNAATASVAGAAAAVAGSPAAAVAARASPPAPGVVAAAASGRGPAPASRANRRPTASSGSPT